MSTRKERRGKHETKEQGKIFQMKKKNENISFNFYPQVLVLVKTEMQIQPCKYVIELLTFFLTLSSNFLSCDSCVFIFCVFIPVKLKNISCWIY